MIFLYLHVDLHVQNEWLNRPNLSLKYVTKFLTFRLCNSQAMRALPSHCCVATTWVKIAHFPY